MNIGLIAHDAKKKLMQNFCIAYRDILKKHNLYATDTTGQLIERSTGLYIHKFLAGHLGGESQLRSQVESGGIDMVFFLRDPFHAKRSEPDLSEITKVCDENNIPYATNLGTAQLMIIALDRGDMDWKNT